MYLHVFTYFSFFFMVFYYIALSLPHGYIEYSPWEGADYTDG